MPNPKKILILFASSGAGHRKASEAIREAFIRFYKDIEIDFFDALDFTNPFFKKSYPAGYEFIVNKFPFIWRFFYYALDIKIVYPLASLLRRLINTINCKGLEGYITANKPDLIITTHFMPVEVISYLKRKGKFNGKLLTVVTDFGLHSFWISNEVDRYVVAIESTKKDLIKRGTQEALIEALGIPVRLDFLAKKDKSALISMLGLKEGVFTVLIASGGFGAGPVEGLLKNILGLDIDKQILIVCGKNNNLYQRLLAISRDFSDNCKIYGFIDNIDELMRVADVLITKSGGLTCSEALATGTPMVIVSPIPGQETKNARVMVENGTAVMLKKTADINGLIRRFNADKNILDRMRRSSRNISHPESSVNIAKLAINLLGLKDEAGTVTEGN